jgi:hypothetical protein
MANTPSPAFFVAAAARLRRAVRISVAAWHLCCAALLAAAAPSAQAGVNGLWTTTSGDYVVFLQDATSGTTVALQVPASFEALKAWLGSGSASAITLQGLTAPTDMLSAQVSGSSMTGSASIGGLQQPFSAALALAWVATDYAGVWQKSSPTNAYLVFCVLNTGNGKIGVQIDVTLNADKTTSYDIFTGALAGTQFAGLSLTGSGRATRLDFMSADQLSGANSTVARPVQTIDYTASHIVKTAP